MTPAEIALLARQALEEEVLLTPKPGLVDRRNTGAHTDMDADTFLRSAAALEPFFERLAQAGAETASLAADGILPLLRPVGLAGEEAMYRATGGINTHKGALFSMGLLCAAAGRLSASDRVVVPDALCKTAAELASGVSAELSGSGTHGLDACRRYGGRGVRGEAEDGFPSVLELALPAYRTARKTRSHEEAALCALLALTAQVDDTTVLHRAGREGLCWLQEQAKSLLPVPGKEALEALDDCCIARNISPGGCADLLAVMLFLLHFSR